MTDDIECEDATVSDFIDMRKALGDAETVLDRLNGLADGAQDAAELVCASDLEPTACADIPERSGLVRKEQQ